MIAPDRRWSGRTIALVGGALAVAVALSLARGLQEQVGYDFHVFWQAGRNFVSGDPLYHGDLPGARKFIYPPFGAMVFMVLAIFPLKVAAVLFSFANLVLAAVAVYLTKRIVMRTFPDRNLATLPLIVAVVLSFVYFQDNFNHVQVNGVIFVLILLGIDAYLREKDVAAAAWLVAATAIKIKPVFFLIWLVVRGRRRAALAVPPLALACVVVPLLVRGPAVGIAELTEYYHSFLEQFQHGGVATSFTNQTLGAMVYRMMRPEENLQHLDYAYLPASEHAAQVIYKASAAVLFLLFLANLGLQRARRAPVSAFELSTVFLISDLLSPISWKAHLVTLLFVFYTFLVVRLAALTTGGRLVAAALGILMGVTGLSGRDLLGSTAFYYHGGYSVAVWTMLMLFVTGVVVTAREASGRRLPPVPTT